jgi:hypothetical protein
MGDLMFIAMNSAKVWLRRTVSAGMLFGGLLFSAAAPTAHAAAWEDCDRRIDRANFQLREAVEDFGPGSSQANYWRHQLHEAYEDCRAPRSYSNAAFNIGYQDGINAASADIRQGKYYQPERHPYFNHADNGYHKNFGDKYFYQQQYREAFLRGYRDTFNPGRR